MGLLDIFGGGNKTQATTQTPWAPLQPYLSGEGGIFSEAQRLYQQGPQQYYPGQTYAGFDPLQQQSQQLGIDYAGGGLNALASGVQGANRQLLGGQFGPDEITSRYMAISDPRVTGYTDLTNPLLQQYMDPNNPYVQSSIDASVGDMRSQVQDFLDAQVSGTEDVAQNTGQYGSSRHGLADALSRSKASEAIARNTANISSGMRQNAYNQGQNLFGQAYGTGANLLGSAYGIGANMYDSAMGRGLNALTSGISLSPTTGQMGMAPSNLLSTIGGERQGMAQQGITEDVNRFNYNQMAPWQNLQNYAGSLQGNYMGSGGTTTSPVTGSNPFGGILGGLGAGAGVMQAMGSTNPYYLAGGAALGLLGSR